MPVTSLINCVFGTVAAAAVGMSVCTEAIAASKGGPQAIAPVQLKVDHIAQSVVNDNIGYSRIYVKNHNPFPVRVQVTYRPLGWINLRTGTWTFRAYEEAYLTDTTWSVVRFYATGGGKTWGPHTVDLGKFYVDYTYNFYR